MRILVTREAPLNVYGEIKTILILHMYFKHVLTPYSAKLIVLLCVSNAHVEYNPWPMFGRLKNVI